MSDAVIGGISFTPTHDGATAIVFELDFGGGARSKIQVEEAEAVREIMVQAGAEDVFGLIGMSWKILDIRTVRFGISS